MGPVGVVSDSPDTIQELISKAESLLYRVYGECKSAGMLDIILDMRITDPSTLRVRISAMDRNRFRSLIRRYDPTSPFIDRLSQNLNGRGFWVSIRGDEDHYLYALMLASYQN